MFEAGAGLSSMITQRATAESDLRRSYTSAISGLQSSLAQQVFGAQQGIAGAGFETDMARAENIGSGFNLGSVLVGAAASAATGGLAGGLGTGAMQLAGGGGFDFGQILQGAGVGASGGNMNKFFKTTGLY